MESQDTVPKESRFPASGLGFCSVWAPGTPLLLHLVGEAGQVGTQKPIISLS